MDNVRIGIIGTGRIATRFVKEVQKVVFNENIVAMLNNAFPNEYKRVGFTLYHLPTNTRREIVYKNNKSGIKGVYFLKDDGFRDLLRQTYQNKELLLTIWKDKKQSENEIPWILLDEEFKYGI